MPRRKQEAPKRAAGMCVCVCLTIMCVNKCKALLSQSCGCYLCFVKLTLQSPHFRFPPLCFLNDALCHSWLLLPDLIETVVFSKTDVYTFYSQTTDTSDLRFRSPSRAATLYSHRMSWLCCKLSLPIVPNLISTIVDRSLLDV